MKNKLILAMLPVCRLERECELRDGSAPEIGDIGPGSGLVCQELTQRFPSATLAVEGRSDPLAHGGQGAAIGRRPADPAGLQADGFHLERR